jgi:hypothetical protein
MRSIVVPLELTVRLVRVVEGVEKMCTLPWLLSSSWVVDCRLLEDVAHVYKATAAADLVSNHQVGAFFD